jgi:hypothetical protein
VLMAVETVRAPLGTFALVLRVDSTPRGQERWSPLPRGSKEVGPMPKRLGKAKRSPEGAGRTRNPLSWAGLGRSYAHNYFRRADANVF